MRSLISLPTVGKAAPASPTLLSFYMSHRCLAALCRQMAFFFWQKKEKGNKRRPENTKSGYNAAAPHLQIHFEPSCHGPGESDRRTVAGCVVRPRTPLAALDARSGEEMTAQRQQTSQGLSVQCQYIQQLHLAAAAATWYRIV